MMKKLSIFIVCMALVAGLAGLAWGLDIFVDSASGAMYRVQTTLDDDPSQATAKDADGNTPLHAAAGEGQAEIIELLIKYGADVNAKTTTGITPLHDAARNGCKKCVEILLHKGANVNARTDSGDTPLGIALRQGNKEVADVLREAGGTE